MRTVGGSDIGPILGVSPWETPLQAWRRIYYGEQPPETPSMAEGKALEAMIIKEYERETGATCKPWAKGEKDWKRWSPDAVAVFPDGEIRLVEAKWAAHGFREIPPQYYCQVMWYLHHLRTVEGTTIERADLVVREPGKTIKIYPILYDPTVATEIVDAVDRWYQKHIIEGVPPEPRGAKEKIALVLEQLLKKGPKATVAVEGELDQKVKELVQAKQLIKTLEARIKEIEAELVDYMAQHSAIRAKGTSWTATIIDRTGNVAWKEVAMALGANDHPELLEKFRHSNVRYVRFDFSEEV